MFSALFASSLPKFRPSLILYKALLPSCLALSGLFATQAAQAQMPVQNTGGTWVVTDSNGKTITQNPNDGTYMLYGTKPPRNNTPAVSLLPALARSTAALTSPTS